MHESGRTRRASVQKKEQDVYPRAAFRPFLPNNLDKLYQKPYFFFIVNEIINSCPVYGGVSLVTAHVYKYCCIFKGKGCLSRTCLQRARNWVMFQITPKMQKAYGENGKLCSQQP